MPLRAWIIAKKQYWFDIFPSMTENHIARLLEILGIERRKLIKLELQYQEEIKTLNEKHLIEWKEFQQERSATENQDMPGAAPE